MSTQQGQKIGIATATIIGMNAMIGSGIFGIPAALASQVGPAGIVTTIFVAVAVWFMAISLARVAALYPEEGSFYAYAKQWGGHLVGVVASGAYLIGLLIAMGLLAKMAGENLTHYEKFSYFPNLSAYSLGFITLVILTLLNMMGVVLSELGQQVLICSTVFPLLATIVICLTRANLSYITPFAPHGWLNVLQATRVVIFSFFGFECAASLFQIVHNPQKNVPRALAYSLALVSILYILFTGSIILSIPLSTFGTGDVHLSQALKLTFPNLNWVIEAIHISTLSAIVGTIHSMIWTSSNLLISLVKVLKNRPAKMLIRSGMLTGQSSVLCIGAAIFTSFTFLENRDLFFSLTALFIVFAYILSMITLLTRRTEWNSGQNIKTIIGLATATTILFFAAENIYSSVVALIS